jgi:hypothetical protein
MEIGRANRFFNHSKCFIANNEKCDVSNDGDRGDRRLEMLEIGNKVADSLLTFCFFRLI